jgi:hypothetical protein
MKIVTYKPGKYLSSYKTKNKYYQHNIDGELGFKGYRNVGYEECYIWRNKGLKYRI